MKNYGIELSRIGKPLFFTIVVSRSALFLNQSIDFVFLKVASLALLKVGWLVIILIPFSVK